MRFEVRMSFPMTNAVFWNVTRCACCPCHQSTSILVMETTVSPKRRHISNSLHGSYPRRKLYKQRLIILTLSLPRGARPRRLLRIRLSKSQSIFRCLYLSDLCYFHLVQMYKSFKLISNTRRILSCISLNKPMFH
jgi:hypothetical protein